MSCLAQGLAVAGAEKGAQGVHTAAQVADAHGAGKGIAVDLSKGLHLHGAGEGDDGVGQHIQGRGHQAHGEQGHDLLQQDKLSPVDARPLLKAVAHTLGGSDTQGEEDQRHQIMGHFGPVPGEQILAEQDDVARLGVGEHLAPGDIGVGVLQSAGQGQKRRRQQGLGHLPAMLVMTHKNDLPDFSRYTIAQKYLRRKRSGDKNRPPQNITAAARRALGFTPCG